MNTNKPFDDDLSDLIGGAPRPRAELPEFKPVLERAFTEACPSCRGTGRWGFRADRQCFKCQGTGKLSFKTPAEQRAKARAGAAERRTAKAAERHAEANAWREQHQAEVAWLNATAERQHERAHRGQTVWNFPIELVEKLAKFGSLTEGQLGAVRKCMIKDEQRATERQAAAQIERKECDPAKLTASFAKARAAAAEAGEGVKFLKLRIGGFLITPDKSNTTDVWFKSGDGWVGKTEGGKFKKFRACTDEQEQQIIAICDDPKAAAEAHGLRTGECACCGRELTNRESIDRGVGPICAEKWGF